MTSPKHGDDKELQKYKLPARDWILLPLLGLLTMAAMLITVQVVSKRLYPYPPEAKGMKIEDCLIDEGPVAGILGKPNSVCHGGILESNLVEYKFNSCGDRDAKECHQKPEGTYRILLLGTSTALGWSVPQEETFAALLPDRLSRETGRKIDLYNESMMFQSPANVLHRFDEVLAAKPDLILWTLPPIQPMNMTLAPSGDANSDHQNNDQGGGLGAFVSRLQDAISAKIIPGAVQRRWRQLTESHVEFLLRHMLNESQTGYVSSYLGGSEAEFLKNKTYTDNPDLLKPFEQSAAEIIGRSKAAGIPLVVVMLPFRAQVAMISMGDWPAGCDPYRLDNELREIIVRHGGTYISILPDYRQIANPEKDYFPVDGHPTADGHAVLARLLAKELTNGAVPALSLATQAKNTTE